MELYSLNFGPCGLNNLPWDADYSVAFEVCRTRNFNHLKTCLKPSMRCKRFLEPGFEVSASSLYIFLTQLCLIKQNRHLIRNLLIRVIHSSNILLTVNLPCLVSSFFLHTCTFFAWLTANQINNDISCTPLAPLAVNFTFGVLLHNS